MAEARRRCERLGDKMAEAWRCSERNRDGFAGLRVILQIWTLGDNFFGAHSASAPPPSHNFLHLLYTITPYLPSILSFTFYPLPYNQDHRIYLFYLSPQLPIVTFYIYLTLLWGEQGKATSQTQLPNLISPIFGSARSHRASELPPNSLPGMIFHFESSIST